MRIYIVDDEKLIAETLALILSMKGHSALWFTDPLEVIRMVEACPPDLLISDVMMPQLSGIDLAILVRSRFPHCNILLLSAHLDHLPASCSSTCPGLVLLAKPVHPDAVLVAIYSLPTAGEATTISAQCSANSGALKAVEKEEVAFHP